MCAEFEVFKIKVPVNFLGTAGFSACRGGRYSDLSTHSSYMQWLEVLAVSAIELVKMSQLKIHGWQWKRVVLSVGFQS